MNSSGNITALYCAYAASVAQPPFDIILAVEIILGLLSIIPNVFLLVAVIQAKIYPSNLRYLLLNLSFCLIVQNCSNAVKAILNIGAGQKGPCFFIISAFDCELQDLAAGITGSVVFYTLLAISLERLYCSIRYRKSDYSSSKPIVAIIFLLIMWSVSIAPSANALSALSKDVYVPLCEFALYITASEIQNTLIIAMVIEIAPLIIVFLVRMYDQYNLRNSAINRVHHTLNFRFQLIQCAQLNGIILPSLVLHAICYMPTLILYFVLFFGVNVKPSTKWCLFHAGTIYQSIYACTHPILAFNRNSHLRHRLRKMPFAQMTAKVANLANPNETPCQTRQQNNITVYFNVLENMWAAGPNTQKITD